MMPQMLKTSLFGNEFLHNNLSATGNRFPDLKLIQFTYKENEFKLSNDFKSPISFFIDEITCCRKVTKNTIIMPHSKTEFIKCGFHSLLKTLKNSQCLRKNMCNC